MASFYTEQQSLDVREGLARRVQNGLFVSKPPFGYRNIRINGRSIVEIHPENAAVVRRAFELYAHHNHTLDTLSDALVAEGLHFSPSTPRFTRSKLYTVLTDRAYIGEINHKGQWLPGTHQMTYASELIECGHCGCPITGEKKKVKDGQREYTYYRCTQYHRSDLPRTRLTENEIDGQILAFFDQLRVEDDDFRQVLSEELRKATNWDQRSSAAKAKQLQEELIQVREKQDRLLNEILCLNWKLDGVTLVPEMRKPFDLLAEGLQKKDSRGDRI